MFVALQLVFSSLLQLVCQAPNLSGDSFAALCALKSLHEPLDEQPTLLSLKAFLLSWTRILTPSLQTLTSKSVGQFLQTQQFTPSQCKVLEGNNVDGKMFLKLTRTDLEELFPDDFPTRKSLWDFLSSMEGKKIEHFLQKRVPSTLPYLLFNMEEGPFTRERLGTAQIFVIVDKDVLCECTSQAKQSLFTSSLITLLAVFYAFNLHYGHRKEHVQVLGKTRPRYCSKTEKLHFKTN